jgi:hypothetical protein
MTDPSSMLSVRLREQKGKNVSGYATCIMHVCMFLASMHVKALSFDVCTVLAKDTYIRSSLTASVVL